MVLHITPWERSALQLLANGTATNDLAGGLGISQCEVEAHLTTLFERMGATSRTEAIAAAFRRGLLAPDDQISRQTPWQDAQRRSEHVSLLDDFHPA